MKQPKDPLIGIRTEIEKQNTFLKKHPPRVTSRDKGKITVQFDFDYGRIPIKLRATYREWIDLEWTEPITFEFIEFFLSKPIKANSEALQRYAESSPDDFMNDIYFCA